MWDVKCLIGVFFPNTKLNFLLKKHLKVKNIPFFFLFDKLIEELNQCVLRSTDSNGHKVFVEVHLTPFSLSQEVNRVE